MFIRYLKFDKYIKTRLSLKNIVLLKKIDCMTGFIFLTMGLNLISDMVNKRELMAQKYIHYYLYKES